MTQFSKEIVFGGLILTALTLTQSTPVASANPEAPEDGPYTDIGECASDPTADNHPVNPFKLSSLSGTIEEWPTDPLTCKTLTANAIIYEDPGLNKEAGYSLSKGKRTTVIAQGIEPSAQNPKFAGSVYSERVTFRDNQGTRRSGFVSDRAYNGQLSRPRP